jgi:hypothetical protein
MSKRETKSPIKDLPLRQPGQSSREAFDQLLEDRLLFPLMFAGGFCLIAFIEWIAVWFKVPRSPWLWTVVATIITIGAGRFILKNWGQFRARRLGITGEEAVGQYLEQHLRSTGFQVLHDIPANGFNLDHVVIGPSGVFVIETKTHSKPAKGASAVRYDGESVSVNGFKPDRDPIVQAKSEARWLSNLFEQSTGRKVFVQPVVLYPGWFVEPQPPKVDVWVLNEKALPTFINNSRQASLSNEDVHLLAFHLAKYVLSKK